MVQTYERNEKTLTSKQLYEIEQAEKRHERELERKRDAKRKAGVKRSLELIKKYRVQSKYYNDLVQNNLIVKLKTDTYGRTQRG
ncbi:hypothetical protein BUY49_11535 [Staphylococcus devriesei]|uniref:hypothetical protein n=1 Tax=Staphylococcus devriesei TaxID=586733 RepID=UPI000E67D999|nr:hypothetical protein [Staphylococcus devriesei]RIL69147.1 hypothetical protein BUY49_11535 [Staphylococcus devriesei]